MAVKKKTNPLDVQSGFLSRLCGGEELKNHPLVFQLFLSRLCGGEDRRCSKSPFLVFLSRLCGGEDVPLTLQVIVIFSKPPMWR